MTRKVYSGAGILMLVALFGLIHSMRPQPVAAQGKQKAAIPRFEVDANWQLKLPDKWIIGQVSGVAVDARGHIWLIHRPSSLDESELFAAANPPLADCCIPAPPVLEFDEAGKFVQGWGGPSAEYEWPTRGNALSLKGVRQPGDGRAEYGEHGIYVDYKDNVWIGGNGSGNDQILKFTRTGKFLLQIGHHGKSQGSNDVENLNQSTGYAVYPKTNELFVSDGYGNRRVIVFDADTGTYKRHWGAYGNKPDDAAPRTRVTEGPGPQQFNTVHGLAVSNDGIVYVGDRVNNRIQAFKIDGTFVKEAFISRSSLTSTGTAFGVAFSGDPQQQFLYVPDGSNSHVWILRRDTLEILGHFGRWGRYAGQFYHLHSIATDSKGNIYTGESLDQRVQKFAFKGISTSPAEY